MCSVSCLVEDNIDVCLCTYLLQCMNDNIYSMCACLYIQWFTLADYIITLIGYTIYTKLGVLVDACQYDKHTHNIPLLLIE